MSFLRILTFLSLAALLLAACETKQKSFNKNNDDDDGGGSTGSGSTGSGSLGLADYEAYCDAATTCRGGNSMDRDACVVSFNEGVRFHQMYGCAAEGASSIACSIANATCNAGEYGPGSACDHEGQVYERCADAATEPGDDAPYGGGDHGYICAQRAECEGLTQLETYICILELDFWQSYAEAYGGGFENSSYDSCVAAEGECLDMTWQHYCTDDSLACMSAASGIAN